MISEEIKKILDKFLQLGNISLVEATTDTTINLFEKENNINFPQEYREWLLVSDGGELFLPAGIQFYGVEHKPLIDLNNDDRPSDEYIVIGALASGDPILCKKSGNQIVIFNHEDRKIEDDEVYSDFVDFLKDIPNIVGIED